MNRKLAAAACAALVAAATAAAAQSPPPRMVRVEGGTFTMGSDNGPSDERPAHPVTVQVVLDRSATR